MMSSDHGQDARATFPQNLCSAFKELRRDSFNHLLQPRSPIINLISNLLKRAEELEVSPRGAGIKLMEILGSAVRSRDAGFRHNLRRCAAMLLAG